MLPIPIWSIPFIFCHIKNHESTYNSWPLRKQFVNFISVYTYILPIHYSKVEFSQPQRRQSTLLHSDPPFSPSKSSALTISKFVLLRENALWKRKRSAKRKVISYSEKWRSSEGFSGKARKTMIFAFGERKLCAARMLSSRPSSLSSRHSPKGG